MYKMFHFSDNIISHKETIRTALQLLNLAPAALTLFVVNEEKQLIGTLTDGDIRRALLNEKTLTSSVTEVMNPFFRYIEKGEYSPEKIKQFKKLKIKLLPILTESKNIYKFVDLTEKRAILPIDVVIMAGGRGERLRPLTDETPKPLLKVADKPIIEYNIDRLNLYGVDNIHISINYLGEQLRKYFGNGEAKGINIDYVEEDKFLGTIGAVSLVKSWHNDYILVMNSDLLTNIDFEKIFTDFIDNKADMIVATTPYHVKIPYAVMEITDNKVVGFIEKPTKTYYSNAGIYLFRKDLLSFIPENTFFNATDLMELVINKDMNLLHYPIEGYWLDIGKWEDFEKAQEDVKSIQF